MPKPQSVPLPDVRARLRQTWSGRVFSEAEVKALREEIAERLGRDYVVWDKASRIDYKLPGRGTVRAIFRITPEQVEDVRRHFPG